MDPKNPSSSSNRKMKFIPKPSKRKPPTRTSQQTSVSVADEAADSELLMSHFRTQLQSPRHTNDKKRSVRVAFGPQAITPTTTSQSSITINEPDETKSLDETMKDLLIESSSDSDEETYEEPWNYDNNNYPTTLPIRRPYSGNPDILDEAEFGDTARNKEHNEKNINAAAELGLLDKSEKESFVLFKLPRYLPLPKEESVSSNSNSNSNSKGKEAIGQPPAKASHKCSSWGNLAAGRIGKLIVYSTGAIKLKLGETLYDVYAGTGNPCEHVMAMNPLTKNCCLLGQVEKHAVVSVDVDSILDGLTGE